MSNGGRVDDDDEFAGNNNRVTADEFGRSVAKVAVGQICQRLGFHSSNDSALDALSDIVIRYVKDLGKTAKYYANVANRTESNVFDIIQGLEDLGSSSSEASASLLLGMKEIMDYVEVIKEAPFAQPVPSFPIISNRKLIPSFVQMGETPEFKHVPEWLPAFPDSHTYIYSPVWNERTSDPRSDKVELARERRKAESSILRLTKRLLSSGSAVTSSMENHVSVVDTFAPVLQALNGRVLESGENRERDCFGKRPAVRLNFDNGRKMIGDSLDLRLWNSGTGRVSSWFGQHDVMDDKFRRTLN